MQIINEPNLKCLFCDNQAVIIKEDGDFNLILCGEHSEMKAEDFIALISNCLDK
jgi:hypothetical protein